MRVVNFVQAWTSGAWAINALNAFAKGEYLIGAMEIGVMFVFGALAVVSK